MDTKAIVAVKKAQKNLVDTIEEVLELLEINFRQYKGKKVLIKPNVGVPAPPNKGINTSPQVVKAVADLFLKKGAKVIIGESSGVMDTTSTCFEKSGFIELAKQGYHMVDLKDKNLEYVKINIPNGKHLKKIVIPRIILEVDCIISVPVAKTHSAEVVSLSLKNMKGIVPDSFKKKFHLIYGVHNAVVDLLKAIKPHLSIIDCTVAQEGLGPIAGTPVEMGLIAAGIDPVAVDAVVTKLMGFEPLEVRIIKLAHESHIGTADLQQIDIKGICLEEEIRKFKTPEEVLKEILPTAETLFISPKTCSGCRGCVTGALWELKNKNLLKTLENYTIITGPYEELPYIKENKVILMGNCTKPHKEKGDFFIQGCPPWPGDLIGIILGEPVSKI